LLGAGATFTGTSIDLSDSDIATIRIAVFSDVGSAAGNGIEVQASTDEALWFTTDEYNYAAGSGPKIYNVPRIFQFYRIKYTNGATPQASFILQTTLYTAAFAASSHRLEDALSGQDDAELIKGVLAARLPNGLYENIDATAGGALEIHVGGENQDAFGRVRISNPVTLLDSTFTYDLRPRDFEDISSGNGVVTHDANGRFAKLAITAGALGVAGLQSYQYTHYNPGKSHLIFMTLCSDPDSVGYASGQKFEAGYFDDDNGIFIRRDDTGAYAVRRSKVTGSVVEEAVATADFNIDPLDGTGPSGVTLDPTKSQILVIDLQFLGVGRVRIGLEVAGAIIYAHEFNFANAQAGMYMQTGSLPVRWRLEDTGTTGFANSQAYCCMVTTEGGAEQNRGVPLAIGSTAAITAASGADTEVLSIRAGLTFNSLVNRIWNILEDVELLNTGNNEARVKIWYDATVTGGTWLSVDASDSGMEYNLTGTHTPGTGIVIGRFSVPATATAKGAASFAPKNRLPIALDKAGTGRVGIISVTAAGVGGTTPVWGDILWREVR
jgi:hypothetical protein